MNVIKHRTYSLELDVWEATQKQADIEMDKVLLFVKNTLSHCGNVKLTLIKEERE